MIGVAANMRFLPLIICLATPSIAPAAEIVRPADAPANVNLAEKEVRRYVYLRTDELLPIAEAGDGITLGLDRALAA